ncbi:hypothetical protein [Apilactobacillus kunkeei]|uniref:ParM/StbA family protein n=1 Tax=Apilactobacillus kunkeei TaxID=148814 RepID=UPI001C8AC76C|nr:hypothetical protein [Apilactobacillus kunkeei]MBX8456239.1 hypothetical protein [Apilactobacillus kunkeei]
MTKKAVDLGIDIGNNFIKICGREKTIIRPSAVVPLESLPYSLDNIKNERLDVFCDHSGAEKKQYIWGRI